MIKIVPKPSTHLKSSSKNYESSTDRWISSFDNAKQGSQLSRNVLVILAVVLGIGILGLFVASDYQTVRVHQIRADDASQSAFKNTVQRKHHCQASSRNLKQGDSQILIAFADRPEIVDDHKIDGLLGLGHCDDTLLKKASVGKQPGTSLVLLLDYILTLIKDSRLKGDTNPFVVTMTLEAAEPGPGQPNLDTQGYNKARSLVQAIIKQKTAIAIIGPRGGLQTSLHEALGSEKELRICTPTSINKCVDKAFEQARGLGSAHDTQ